MPRPDPLTELKIVDPAGNTVFRVGRTGKVVSREDFSIVTRYGKEILSVKQGKVQIKDENGKLYASFDPYSLWLYSYETDSSRKRLSIRISAEGHGIGLWGNTGREPTVVLDGNAGDIILRNSDCAEDFEVMDGQEVEPGSVMVIEQEGKLRQSTEAYDKRVAGVVSGAGEHHPGIVLGRIPSNGKTMPIALAGKVFCKVDAGQASIQVGDLLTTSDIPGCAMKAMEQAKSFGSVIGKALRPLDDGRGLVPILVALQ